MQSDAERDARAKIKAAETAAKSKVKLSYAEAEKAAADAADHKAKMENAKDEAVANAKAKRRAAKLAPPNVELVQAGRTPDELAREFEPTAQ